MGGIKSDSWIRQMALDHEMIKPFVDHQVSDGIISFGLSSYGYDIRVSDKYSVFTNLNSTLVDPKNFVKYPFFRHSVSPRFLDKPINSTLMIFEERFFGQKQPADTSG
ncbi:MAG: hypothetical protein HY454_03350, partial [Parcubacteria group bacterium]|nr:hypothetical protein [Parcubacteria group bacterium]